MKLEHVVNLARGMKRGAVTSLRRIAGKDRLQYLWLGLTDRCNSRCKTCNIWRKRPGLEMHLKDFIDVLSDPLFENVEYIINSGGEPTLRKDLKQIIMLEHTFMPEATIQVSTNGLLPEKILELAKLAVAGEFKLDIGISLDGFGEKHDRMRGIEGNFDRVHYLLTNLWPMKKDYPDLLSVSVGSTLTGLILDRYPKVSKYADIFGVPYMFHWYDESEYYQNEQHHRLEVSNLFSEAIRTAMPRTLYYDMWLKRLAGEEARFWCFALHTFLVIRPDGWVAPCLHFWDLPVGNVLRQAPSEIWRSITMKAARSFFENCSECLNSWCVGWSFNSYYWPVLLYELRKKFPELFSKKLNQKRGASL